MIPAGYLLKRIAHTPDWLKPYPKHITDIYSLADCVSDNIVDPQKAWTHNGFGLANSPEDLKQLIDETSADTSDSKLFYYEVFEEELDTDGWTFNAKNWQAITPAPSAAIKLDVLEPKPAMELKLEGYDVVVFQDYLEHSPLSCNSVAQSQTVNKHCLFNNLEQARTAIDSGAFGGGCEPGIYKIFSVNSVSDKFVSALLEY